MSTIAMSGRSRRAAWTSASAVGDRIDDLEPVVAEQARQPVAQQREILGDQDAHGSSAWTVVGPPGGLVTVNRPSSASTRRRRPASPRRTGPPRPAVVDDLEDERVADPRDRHVDRDAPPCLAALVRPRRRRSTPPSRRRRRALRDVGVDDDRDRAAVRERRDRRLEPAVAEHRRVDPAREVAQLAQRLLDAARASSTSAAASSGRHAASAPPCRGASRARRAAPARRRAGRARSAGAPTPARRRRPRASSRARRSRCSSAPRSTPRRTTRARWTRKNVANATIDHTGQKYPCPERSQMVISASTSVAKNPASIASGFVGKTAGQRSGRSSTSTIQAWMASGIASPNITHTGQNVPWPVSAQISVTSATSTPTALACARRPRRRRRSAGAGRTSRRRSPGGAARRPDATRGRAANDVRREHEPGEPERQYEHRFLQRVDPPGLGVAPHR